MGAIGSNEPAAPPPPAVMRILGRYSREELAMFVTVAIDLMDLAEPDTELEPTGDEQDGQFAEDEPAARFAVTKDGPGCIVADPDMAADDVPCDDIDQDLEQDEIAFGSYAIDQRTSYPPDTSAERSLTIPHRDRVRRTRCDRVEYRGWGGAVSCVEYRLRDGADQ